MSRIFEHFSCLSPDNRSPSPLELDRSSPFVKGGLVLV